MHVYIESDHMVRVLCETAAELHCTEFAQSPVCLCVSGLWREGIH